MSVLLAYAGGLLAAWAAMGGFCLRTDAVRFRQRWPSFSIKDSRRHAVGASVLSLLSLVLLWQVAQPSFSLILWVVVHGVFGIVIAIGLPFANRILVRSFAIAAAMALLIVPVVFIFIVGG